MKQAFSYPFFLKKILNFLAKLSCLLLKDDDICYYS